jgi:hypothetical protein
MEAINPSSTREGATQTEGRCHSKRPLPLIPARAKSDPGRSRPAILNLYRLDLTNPQQLAGFGCGGPQML